ncbi:putative v-type c subunit family protein [Erysiphe necator]|uniref:Putative v-type c subunit family protein n=1 Tax=Uncinula necator TaxID=52586 RepID=A0A0B1NYK0_UNCNE|nr:putative v-type c subunit family protein [Erysiphe necator]
MPNILNNLRSYTTYLARSNLYFNTKYSKSKQFYKSQRASLKTTSHIKSTDKSFCNSSSNLKPSNCVSLRLSTSKNVDFSRREIINFFKPYVHNLEINIANDNRILNVVILVTPSHITWLENDSVQTFIGQLFVNHTSNNLWEVNVTCACVDGLAPSNREISCGQVVNIFEGISVFLSTLNSKISNLCPALSSSSRQASKDDCCFLTFEHGLDKDTKYSFQVTMPLANTLFINERRSTLITSKWRIAKDCINHIQEPRFPLNTLAYIPITMRDFSLQISAKTLTAPRIIEKGFGNIVRKLRAEGQSSFPASRELERVVAEAHRMNTLRSNHCVWALVFPHEMLDMEDIETQFDNKTINDSKYLERMVKKGAKICRVLSGGGGWGAKEGLLALDPAFSFENTSEHVEKIMSFKSIEENQEMIMGNMAQEGYLIQFLQTSYENNLALSTPTSRQQGNQFVYGCQTADTYKPTSFDSPVYAIMPNLFGCVSETGIFLQSPHIGPSKIDIPYSYIQKK